MANPSRARVWTGRVLSALVVVGLLFSASMKIMGSPQVTEIFGGKLGYPESTFLPIGVLEAACAVLYAIPQTAVLGAILVTGYLGGAVATHVRVSDVFVSPLIMGVVAWLGLYLRESRLRAVLPLRSRSTSD
jgi:xanthine/uracil permease